MFQCSSKFGGEWLVGSIFGNVFCAGWAKVLLTEVAKFPLPYPKSLEHWNKCCKSLIHKANLVATKLACSSDFLEHCLKFKQLYRLSFSDLKSHAYVGRYLRFSEMTHHALPARETI